MKSSISTFIKKARKERKLSQVEFAKLSNLGLRFVRELEQGKTTVRAQKVHNRIEKLGNTVHNTGRIVANDVINTLATAAAKTTATIVSAGAKTIVDCALAGANEIMRDAACFSLNEIKERKEVKQMAYSFNKLMNKTQAKKSNNRANNFNF